MNDRALVRETARATVDAARRAVAGDMTTYVGATVNGHGSPAGAVNMVSYGSTVLVKLDGDTPDNIVPVLNGTATALPIGARVIVAQSPTGAFVAASNNQAGGRYLIAGQRLTTTAATFAFVGIPQCFQYLELVATLRSDNAAGQDCALRLNSIASASYTGELIQWASGGALAGSELATQTSFSWWCFVPGTNETAGYFGQASLRVLNYNSTVAWPTMMGERAFWTGDAGILNGLALTSCTAGSVAAPVTRIDLLLGAGNFIAGSNVELYGVGAAL